MLTESELARRDEGRVTMRRTAMRVRWPLRDVDCSDGMSARGEFGCAVRVLDDPAERRMLDEVFFAHSPILDDAAIEAHFVPRLQEEFARFAAEKDVERLLGDEARGALLQRLSQAAKEIAFGCGLEVSTPFELHLESESRRRQQQEQRLASEQADRLSRASGLFKQFQDLLAAPDVPAGEILSRIAPSDQAAVLRSLLMAAAPQASRRDFYAVAGNALASIPQNQQSTSPEPQTTELSQELGPFRSVQKGTIQGQARLLIGARSGVLAVDPRDLRAAVAFSDPKVTSARGFNSALILGDKIWAAHGEAGLVAWELGKPQSPCVVIRPSESGIAGFAPHDLLALGAHRMICASGGQIVLIGDEGAIKQIDEAAPFIGLFNIDGRLISVHEDGEIVVRDIDTLRANSSSRRTGKLTAAGVLPWMSSQRLLLATADGSITCAGVDDELVTQYLSEHRSLRLAAAVEDRVVAVSADRQRLVFWNSWDGRQPSAEVHVGMLARHRVADIQFV